MKREIGIFATIIIVCLLAATNVTGNDSTVFKINLGGFIKNDILFDTRKNLETVDGLFLFYPLAPRLDHYGNDLNAKNSASLISIMSRVFVSATGVKFLNAKASGHLEFDFTNFTTLAGVRFRHAWSRLDWENSQLMFGLNWHPLFTPDVFPTVMSLNTGAPFQVFNRSPQIRFSHKISNLRFTASAIHQADFKSPGPNGNSSEYLRNAIFPNMNLIIQYETPSLILGITGDYKIIQPKQFVTPLTGPNQGAIIQTNETLASYAANIFLRYTKNNLTFKAKALYGQNLFEHLLPGGYAVSSIDNLTGHTSYTPYNHLLLWGNLIYGKRFQAGLFVGYFKNLGTSHPVTGPLFARAENIDYAYRISPFISYNMPKISISAEVETTVAAYGDIDYLNNARVINSQETAGTRFTFSVSYIF